MISGYKGNFIPAVLAVVPSSGDTTPAIAMDGFSLAGIIFPTTFTGTAVSFLACDTVDGTFVAVKSTTSGSALSYTVAQATYAAIDPTAFQGIAFLKIKSNATEGSARTLKLALKGI